MIRTRFAPSPTGFLHIGGARTALFSWAYAKKNNGKFILRIEDTDIERSTKESVDSIIQAMDWLGLSYDEGPFYQMKRMKRYKEVIAQMLQQGTAYYCYCSKEELEQMRLLQMEKGQKPKYDGRCLNNNFPKGIDKPVVRFKNPKDGVVIWNDLVKGRIEISNSELDDLIIARSDGTPTYNFCVVVDDLDMQITQVIRGDDHVNNTPRQINILNALGATVPAYAHIPMILREDGQKMSKRLDAVSVMQYKEMGVLPEALLNYLARLCWGHGNDEVFNMQQFVTWFNLDHVSSSPARFDMNKLFWVNAQHIKNTPNSYLAQLVRKIWQSRGILTEELEGKCPYLKLEKVLELVKSRADNLNSITDEVTYFYQPIILEDKHMTTDTMLVMTNFAQAISQINDWSLASIKLTIKEFCHTYDLKMPQLGMPLRLKLCGTTYTPSLDAVIHLIGKDEVLNRIYIDR